MFNGLQITKRRSNKFHIITRKTATYIVHCRTDTPWLT